MQLYLVQHGTAKREAEDPQRSLTEEERVVRLDRDATGQWVVRWMLVPEMLRPAESVL